MFDQVFLYCERGLATAASAEPLNALTNAAFLLAALAIRRRSRSVVLDRRRRATMALVASLAGLVALGSFAFHVTAWRLAQIGDVVPIGVTVLVVMYLSLTWICGIAWRPAILLTGVLGGAAVAVAGFTVGVGCAAPVATVGGMVAASAGCLNGSWPYVPVLVALVAVAGIAVQRGAAGAGRLIAASMTFAAALIARSLDLQLCGSLPAVLHGVWHVGAAATLFLAATALIDASRPDRATGVART